MKRIIVTLTIFILVSKLCAQDAFKKNDLIINAGIGLSIDDANLLSYVNAFSPSVLTTFDYAVHDYVSVGIYFGALFYKENDGYFGDFKERAFDVGVRSNFHWWALTDDLVDSKSLKSDALDMYLSILLGGEIIGGSERNFSFPKEAFFRFGITHGLRYYPKSNQHFGILMELGLGAISHVLIGATFKF